VSHDSKITPPRPSRNGRIGLAELGLFLGTFVVLMALGQVNQVASYVVGLASLLIVAIRLIALNRRL
jgi:hypothetical protein